MRIHFFCHTAEAAIRVAVVVVVAVAGGPMRIQAGWWCFMDKDVVTFAPLYRLQLHSTSNRETATPASQKVSDQRIENRCVLKFAPVWLPDDNFRGQCLFVAKLVRIQRPARAPIERAN